MNYGRPYRLHSMGTLTYGMNISVDGYIVDAKGELPDVGPDDEVHQFWNDRVRDTAVSLYGRKLYELMAGFWPTAAEDPNIPPVEAEFARLWMQMPKVVFSQTLSSVGWNSQLERGDVVEVAKKLKAETDGMLDVAGATLAAPLVKAGLVDEFLVMVGSVAVGGGIPFFPTLDKWIKLRLVETRTFSATGSVLLHYVAVRD